MQTDVKSYLARESGTVVNYRTRLKGLTVSTGTASLRNMCVADPSVSKSGTWDRIGNAVTVTITSNSLSNNQRVFLDIAAGTTMRDGVYEVSNVTANTFTVTSVTSGNANGTLVMYTDILVEIDTFNTIGLPIRIPGDGILCENGMFVGLGTSVTATVFYG